MDRVFRFVFLYAPTSLVVVSGDFGECRSMLPSPSSSMSNVLLFFAVCTTARSTTITGVAPAGHASTHAACNWGHTCSHMNAAAPKPRLVT